ncbi:ZINC KNUCKLE CX2CX4HX4C-RELATED [Salix viminalis]|uniref:ZINC KNUCKLE CX2CX4HX4C-RELATED n=1 Tax=Salix viminalis TaxID=40686 RepID=A0A9Q0V794_SALVM|nr:ZINC KNUCKLE CX2CX4HX4C-RELATED [Salix viminalis]
MSQPNSPTLRVEKPKATGQQKLNNQQGQNNGRKPQSSWAEKVKVTNANTRFTLESLPRHPPDQQMVIPEEAMENSDNWERCLVGFFPGYKFPYHAINSMAMRVWKDKGLEAVITTANGFNLFRFKTQDALKGVLEQGPWLFGGKHLILQQWSPRFQFDITKITSLPVWIRLRGLPLPLWSTRGLSMVASMVGTPLSCDEPTHRCTRLEYARICVEIDATLPYVHQFQIHTPLSSSPITIQVDYEWKPARCSKCKVFGHACVKIEVEDNETPIQGANPGNDKSAKTAFVAEKDKPEPGSQFDKEQTDMSSTAIPNHTQNSHAAGTSQAPKQTQHMQTSTPNPTKLTKTKTSGHPTETAKMKISTQLNDNTRPDNTEPADLLESLAQEKATAVAKAKGKHLICTTSTTDTSNSFTSLKDDTGESASDTNAPPDSHTEISSSPTPTVLSTPGSQSIFRITFIYGYNSPAARQALWDYISHHHSAFSSDPWLLMGDFNAILDNDDRNGGSSLWQGHQNDFGNCISSADLVPIHYTGLRHTWHNSQGINTIQKKLDLSFGNAALLRKWKDAHTIFLPRSISDHSPGITLLSRPVIKLHSPFKFLNLWADKEEFLPMVASTWQQEVEGHPFLQLIRKLRLVKAQLKKFHQLHSSHITRRVNNAKDN